MKTQRSILVRMMLVLTVLWGSCASQENEEVSEVETNEDAYVLVIHGGAGVINRDRITPDIEGDYHAALEEALQAGYDILKDGGSSLDAVEKAVHVLENTPLFNSGKGSVFTNDGKNELDASIMDGSTKMAGAVAGVTTIKNPISAARAVMEHTPHVILIGEGADKFANEQGLEIVDPSYYFDQRRWDALERARAKDAIDKTASIPGPIQDNFGTVGCVAIDQEGRIAAGTSTGGMNNKRFGRVGDVPIIGAGNYANDLVGVSCTGWGEHFIRNVVSYDIAAAMEYKGLSLEEAAQSALDKVAETGGTGGIIAIDKNGNLTMPFNTEGMYRGSVTKDGKFETAIFGD